MSWKMYSLGSLFNAVNVANAAMPILESLGYATSYTNISNAQGNLSVTIDGVVYTGGVYAQTNQYYTYYLFVNDETNDIVITAPLNGSSEVWHDICFALLSGTNLLNGETGMFPIADTGVQYSRISNAWMSDFPADVVIFQKAVFFKNPSSSYQQYNANTFESTLYFGTQYNAPGVIITVGDDNFVCLEGRVYAKL